MRVTPFARWCLGLAIALFLVVVPYVYYRVNYRTDKRLRVVSAGAVYRSGCMMGNGFRDAIKKWNIRTVINLMEEAPDPDLPNTYFSKATVKESELCRELGARFIFLEVKLVPMQLLDQLYPETIDRFREIMDDPDSYPVLIHCKAGLHRTGCLVALYRMEYEGWSRAEAIRELKANGFGEFTSSSANPYILEYVTTYQPRPRGPDGRF